MPIIFRKFQYVCHIINMLLPFCELAFTDLMSAEIKLVFNRGQLERQLGKSHVYLAHRLGLISQTKFRVNFNHKSVQELLAAVYMTCGTPDALTSFCGYCSTLEKVVETANITKFVVGLDPSLGCRIFEHITNIINSDKGITEYRQTLNFKIWDRELTHVRTVTGDTSPPPSPHVTDIWLDKDSDTVRLTWDLMCSYCDTIVSVTLWGVEQREP